ncbi:putative nicotinate phosphoribosyltransferase [Microlunatus phosphovorus NM-1]|uniref:Nicotinate phosphoribosyltransferase n=1 Tax=Microlunatus phosphovorus (strain ATCC 700054 / DSM 10555 / JCM 9379 / NBRC 101784 / NCIMB 13414 / VKM Ac-1990 / NM-1) TaxID=1032480 RepID=F5XQ78_MICPN|nr:putative nicotinate phosphoribosyltransferase [Microlunatus phosphovorus NM-1]
MSLSSAWGPTRVPTTALLTDHYELTMLRAALQAGTANRHSVFELFGRRLPPGRRYGVVCGVGRALRALRAFHFDEESLRFLLDTDVVDQPTADWLADFRFSGDIWGYPEGEIYFPGSPLLVVDSTFAEGVILETVLLSIYNHDSAIASAASRMTAMAGDRPCIEMGSRRTQELAAVAAARAAYIAGFEATSNLEAGRRYHVPTRGTSAHSFTLLHGDETEAFRAQIAALGTDTTLLVDTYDVTNAVRTGVELTDGKLGAVRLDSGDLALLATQVRALLDSLGATQTKIIVTSDLDEWNIAALSGAPVDGYGVGTALVTGSGHPTCGFVYKLVARADTDDPGAPLVSVAKKSTDKVSVGGRKFALRRFNDRGVAELELIGIGAPPVGDHNDRELLVPLVQGGEILVEEDLAAARERHRRSRAELPLEAWKMSRGEPVIDTAYLDEHGSLDNPYAPKL